MKTYYLLIILSTLLLSCNKKDKEPATLTTTNVITITDTTATVTGKITNDGNLEIIERGVVWSEHQNPTIEDNSIIDNSNNDNIYVQIVGLSSASNYFVRTYAQNKVGVSYGNEIEFTTTYTILSNSGQAVTDIDGNTYETLVLGNGQTWMTENLRVSSCSDGTPITNIQNNNDWSSLNTSAWSFYNNNSNYETPYGKLYNWHSVISCDVCPTGWRVPSIEDFNELVNYLDPNSNKTEMINDAGSKMKTLGTLYWAGDNTNATNESGFSAIPGGSRTMDGTFSLTFDHYARYWTINEDGSSIGAYGAFISYSSSSLQVMGFHKTEGLSIRCIKN